MMGYRLRHRDFSGREFTLAPGAAHYEIIAENGGDLLFLGAGPDWQNLPIAQKAFESGNNIYILQSPALLVSQKDSLCQNAADLRADSISSENASKIYKSATILFYRPAMRIDPDFWEKFLGEMEAGHFEAYPKKQLAWLPGHNGRLLHQEMRLALEEHGYAICEDDFSRNPQQFMRQENLPEIAVSVNFHGLDADGRIFNFCRAKKIPVAVWLVDNPWNLLSSIRLPWWKHAVLFATDATFIPDLRKAGACSVHFLPLAAAQHFFNQECDGKGMPVFVGRSEFPEKKKFFAAASVPEQMVAEAQKDLETGNAPDFYWWHKRLGGELWPGFAVRNTGFGAETFSQKNRQRWLCAGASAGMEIYGDDGWKELVPDAVLRPPVDYYGGLAKIYARASAVLNITSLLLPQSLNQRHFDVWAANGLLLSDATKGLKIFPSELVRPIIVKEPRQLAGRLKFFATEPDFRRRLIDAWREEILGHHLYRHRIGKILAILQKS